LISSPERIPCLPTNGAPTSGRKARVLSPPDRSTRAAAVPEAAPPLAAERFFFVVLFLF
jgi:hypothetical protein